VQFIFTDVRKCAYVDGVNNTVENWYCRVLIWLKFSTIEQYHLIFLSVKELTPEAIIIHCIIILFITIYKSIVFSVRLVNIWNSLPNSLVDACTVNAFKARLDKFWQHQAVKFDFTADMTGTGNRSEEFIK